MKRTLFALLSLASFSASAQDTATATAAPRTITVNGNAESILPADRVRISGALRSVRDDLADARNASQEAFTSVIKSLGELGVPSEKIELENHSLGREFENGPDGRRIAKGFFSERQFIIELDDASLLELVHGSLAESTEVAVHHTAFSRKDEIEVRAELRKSALTAALEKAGAMAAVYGQKVGKPLKMSEGGGMNPMPFNNRAFAAMDGGSVGGRVALEAMVEVTFELVE